jgi:UDP-glucuronate 4-epimerase
VLATWADIRKAGRLLDWRPRVSFQEGMQQLVSWYQVNRPWAKDVAA